MPDEQASYSPEALKRKTAVAAFIASVMTSSKTAGLYKPGHPAILQVADRVRELLARTLGQEETLTVDIRAKTVAVEEMELDVTPDITAFSSALHTLGVGQVLFTKRITKEGFVDFFRALTAKPDETKTLTDLQKEIQTLRVDGLQMVFVLSFVVTGEEEEKPQTPGVLSEEQLAAFTSQKTLPDFLTLLHNQNAEVRGKQAEGINDLFEGVLYKEISVDKLEAELPWEVYDARIRQRWDELRAAAAWRPKEGAARPKWPRDGVVTWASTRGDVDLAALRTHAAQEARAALEDCLSRSIAMLDAAPSPSHRKYAGLAYARYVGEAARAGAIDLLLAHLPRWTDEALKTEMRARLLCGPVVEHWSAALGAAKEPERFEKLTGLALFLGEPFYPMALDRLRVAQEKEERQALCAALLVLARTHGDGPLVAALKDEEWLFVSQVAGLLAELGSQDNAKAVAPLLKRGNKKVREAAVKFLTKVGGPKSVDALAAFVVAAEHPDEITRVCISLSQMDHPSVGKRLCEGLEATKSYESKVAIARALSRFPGSQTVNVLAAAARRSWYEALSGVNKELREAARQSLEQLRKEGKA